MCIIYLAYRVIDTVPLLLAANRDEFYARPTQSMHFWEDAPHVLAGKDLRAGGTWLGVTTHGRLAVVTNFRDPTERVDNPISRGQLPEQYLRDNPASRDYLQRLQRDRHRYRGYNLIFGSLENLFYYSNRLGRYQRLSPGLYGLCNHYLNTPWPKLSKGLKTMMSWGTDAGKWSNSAVFSLLEDSEKPADHLLPDTGVGLEWERLLSSIFIRSPSYGTRHSSLLRFWDDRRIAVEERVWNQDIHQPQVVQYEIPPVQSKVDPFLGLP